MLINIPSSDDPVVIYKNNNQEGKVGIHGKWIWNELERISERRRSGR